MTGKELIDMLKIIKEQAIKSNNDTAIIDIKIDSFNFVIGETIKALEQEPVIDKIRSEIEQIEINGHIRDVECFSAGINVALNVIDKYRAESEE